MVDVYTRCTMVFSFRWKIAQREQFTQHPKILSSSCSQGSHHPWVWSSCSCPNLSDLTGHSSHRGFLCRIGHHRPGHHTAVWTVFQNLFNYEWGQRIGSKPDLLQSSAMLSDERLSCLACLELCLARSQEPSRSCCPYSWQSLFLKNFARPMSMITAQRDPCLI